MMQNPPRRILLINANTTPAMTDAMARRAGAMAPEGVTFVPLTAHFGGAYIASRATAAIGAHAVLDLYASHRADCDAVLVGCFGDPGLLALREISSVPVTGLAEASCLAAARHGRFSIVTGGRAWDAMLREFIASIGLSQHLASVRTVSPTGADIARDPDAAIGHLAAASASCVRDDGADVVILGGAGLIGLADRVAPRIDKPVYCSVELGIRAAIKMVEDVHAIPRTGAPVGSIGLSTSLEALLAGMP